MKRLISIILILLMLISLLTSCENEEAPTTTSSVESSSLSESSLPPDEIPQEEEPIYYEAIEITAEDILRKHYCYSGRIFLNMNQLSQGMTEEFMNEFLVTKRSVFDENKLVICKIKADDSPIAFKSVDFYESCPYVMCEYDGSVAENMFGDDGTYRMFLVIVPKGDIPSYYSNIHFKIEEPQHLNRGFQSQMVSYHPKLGSEDKLILFDNQHELENFEKEMGVNRTLLSNQGRYYSVTNEYVVLVHYVAKRNYNESSISYKGLSFGDNSFSLQRIVTYTNEIGVEHDVGLVYYIKLPRFDKFDNADIVGEIKSYKQVVSGTVEPVEKKEHLLVANSYYSPYCDKDYLPSEYGTHFWLVKNGIEYEKMTGRSANNPLFIDNYMIAIYRNYENYDYKPIGFKDFEVADGTIWLTVEEKSVFSNGEAHKDLHFVVVPRREIDESGIKRFELELTSEKTDCYGCIEGIDAEAPNDVYPKKSEPLYIYQAYDEFAKDWLNEINPAIFDTHIALAIPQYAGSSAFQLLGYYDASIDGDKIVIHMDYFYEGWGDCMMHYWYDIVFIPKKEICISPDVDYQINLIHSRRTNWMNSGWYYD